MENYRTKLTSWVYKNALSGRTRRLWLLLRRVLIKSFHDPECLMPIHERELYLPLSHALPQYLANLPLYDSLLKRLANFLRQKYGYVYGIDVGANIGDTIAALYDEKSAQDLFLCIEPNPHFRKYLSKNWSDETRVKIVPYLCVAQPDQTQKYQIVEYDGSAEFLQNDTGISIESRTLSQIIEEQPEFEQCNIIKIDTDGHDFDVIRGSIDFIKRRHPAIFFECAPMSNPAFIKEVLDTLKLFADARYQSFLAYDNFGHFIGKFSLSALPLFRNILIFQLTSRLFFIDILVLAEEDTVIFEKQELQYFISTLSDPNMRSALTWATEQQNL